MLVQKIIKHGNSLAIVIPANLCKVQGLKRGDFLVLRFRDDETFIVDFGTPLNKPVKTKELYEDQHKTIKHD